MGVFENAPIFPVAKPKLSNWGASYLDFLNDGVSVKNTGAYAKTA